MSKTTLQVDEVVIRFAGDSGEIQEMECSSQVLVLQKRQLSLGTT